MALALGGSAISGRESLSSETQFDSQNAVWPFTFRDYLLSNGTNEYTKASTIKTLLVIKHGLRQRDVRFGVNPLHSVLPGPPV